MSHVIVGAGTVGRATALLLANQGHQVRLISRRGRGPDHPDIEKLAVDATDADAMTPASAGAAALYNCASSRSNIEVEFVRVVLAVRTVVVGAGLSLYLSRCLLIPHDGTEESVAFRFPNQLPLSAGLS